VSKIYSKSQCRRNFKFIGDISGYFTINAYGKQNETKWKLKRSRLNNIKLRNEWTCTSVQKLRFSFFVGGHVLVFVDWLEERVKLAAK